MAFNGQGIPHDELVAALGGFAAEWDGVLTPTGAELARYVSQACGRPDLDTLAVGNRARREFVKLYGEGSRHRPRTRERPAPRVEHVAPAPAQPVVQSRAELPDVERWDRPTTPTPARSFAISPMPEEDDTDDDLVARRVEAFRRYAQRAEREATRTVTFNASEPIGIVAVGDPHADDDGCDWPELLRVVRTVGATPGMYGWNVGDVTNNWIGRLVRLWAHQSSTEDDADRLAAWLMRSMPWLMLVLGNHDRWQSASVQAAAKAAGVHHVARHLGRIEFAFPNGASVRVEGRHTYKGSSIYNPTHGLARGALWDQWGDVYIAGHHHEASTQRVFRQDGRLVTLVKARGFKRYDDYAAEHQFADVPHGHAPTVIIDPTARSVTGRVQVIEDIEDAADLLTWMRRRRAA